MKRPGDRLPFRIGQLFWFLLALALLGACGRVERADDGGTSPKQGNASQDGATPAALGKLAYVRDGDIWVQQLSGDEPLR